LGQAVDWGKKGSGPEVGWFKGGEQKCGFVALRQAQNIGKKIKDGAGSGAIGKGDLI